MALPARLTDASLGQDQLHPTQLGLALASMLTCPQQSTDPLRWARSWSDCCTSREMWQLPGSLDLTGSPMGCGVTWELLLFGQGSLSVPPCCCSCCRPAGMHTVSPCPGQPQLKRYR